MERTDLTLTMIALFLHFLFDWVIQGRETANKKGLSREGIIAVARHMFMDIFPFHLILMFFMIGSEYSADRGFSILTINFISHGLLDIFLVKGETEREKINATAVDQFLHISILILLINW